MRIRCRNMKIVSKKETKSHKNKTVPKKNTTKLYQRTKKKKNSNIQLFKYSKIQIVSYSNIIKLLNYLKIIIWIDNVLTTILGIKIYQPISVQIYIVQNFNAIYFIRKDVLNSTICKNYTYSICHYACLFISKSTSFFYMRNLYFKFNTQNITLRTYKSTGIKSIN